MARLRDQDVIDHEEDVGALPEVAGSYEAFEVSRGQEKSQTCRTFFVWPHLVIDSYIYVDMVI